MAAFVKGAASATDTSNTSVIAAQGAGVITYLTDIIITNATGADDYVIVKDGTTEVMRIAVGAGETAGATLSSPIAGTANTAWQFAAVTGGSTIYATFSGFTGA